MHEMQSDVHDVEETVLTITRVKRSYSPWSSKIYTLRETPHMQNRVKWVLLSDEIMAIIETD